MSYLCSFETLAKFFRGILFGAPGRDDGLTRFRRQTVKVDVRTGAIVKNSGICSVGGVGSKNSIFAFLGYPSTILRTDYRKQFTQTNTTDGKPRL